MKTGTSHIAKTIDGKAIVALIQSMFLAAILSLVLLDTSDARRAPSYKKSTSSYSYYQSRAEDQLLRRYNKYPDIQRELSRRELKYSDPIQFRRFIKYLGTAHPLFHSTRTKNRDKTNEEYVPPKENDARYSIYDGVHGYGKTALERILSQDVVARRMGLASWKFTSPPNLKQIGRLLTSAKRELPGEVELGLFLDPITFGPARRKIAAAWGSRPRSEMPHEAVLESALKDRSGSTWIVVGHVEGKHFVKRDAAGRTMRLSIPKLIAMGLRHNVVVVPVGCSTAAAGAPVGFIRSVGSESVANFLKSLPTQKATFADLWSSFGSIGPFTVNLNGIFGQFAAFAGHGSGATRSTSHITVPRNGGPSYEDTFVKPLCAIDPQSPSCTVNIHAGKPFADLVIAEAGRLQPWYERWPWRIFVSGPIPYALIWIALSFAACRWRRHLIVRDYLPPSPALVSALEMIGSINSVLIVLAKIAFWIAVAIVAIMVVAIVAIMVVVNFPPLFFIAILLVFLIPDEKAELHVPERPSPY